MIKCHTTITRIVFESFRQIFGARDLVKKKSSDFFLGEELTDRKKLTDRLTELPNRRPKCRLID